MAGQQRPRILVRRRAHGAQAKAQREVCAIYLLRLLTGFRVACTLDPSAVVVRAVSVTPGCGIWWWPSVAVRAAWESEEVGEVGGSAGLTVRVEHMERGASRIVVIEAVGEIDLGSVPELRRALLEGLEQGPVVLDAAYVAFCDSLGLRSLVEARRGAHERGVSFRLAGPSPAVIRVLELAGALEMFEIFPDLETALKD